MVMDPAGHRGRPQHMAPGMMPQQQQQQQNMGLPFQQMQQRQVPGLPAMVMQPGASFHGPFPMVMSGMPFQGLQGPVMYSINGPAPAHLMALHPAHQHPWPGQPFMQQPQHMPAAQHMCYSIPNGQPQHRGFVPAGAAARQPAAMRGRPVAAMTQQDRAGPGLSAAGPANAAARSSVLGVVDPAAGKTPACVVLVQQMGQAAVQRLPSAVAATGVVLPLNKKTVAASAGSSASAATQGLARLNTASDWSDDDDPTRSIDMPHGSSDWANLTGCIMVQIIEYLKANNTGLASFRATCSTWKRLADATLESLSPKALLPKDLILKFPALKALQLVSCRNVRNRDLFVLANGVHVKAGQQVPAQEDVAMQVQEEQEAEAVVPGAEGVHYDIQLTSLVLGDDTNKPWVTNRGIESIAKMTGLSFLGLHDCNSITNKGIVELKALEGLETLSLRGCRKLTNNGMQTIKLLTQLTRLNLFGCKRLSDAGIKELTELPLVALSLGQTRVRDAGLAHIAALTKLTELHLVKEDFRLDAYSNMSSLTNLEVLSLRDLHLCGAMLTAALKPLIKLRELSLFRNPEINNAIFKTVLTECSETMRNLQWLDLRETGVTMHDAAVRPAPGQPEEEKIAKHIVTSMVELKALKLRPSQAQVSASTTAAVASYLGVGVLTQLTSLSLALPVLGTQMMQVVGKMTGLEELDLSRGYAPINSLLDDHVLHAGVYAEVAHLTRLTSLDLSRRRMVEKEEAEARKEAGRKPKCPAELQEMLSKLPRLSQLNLDSTFLDPWVVRKLTLSFNRVNIDGSKSMEENTADLANYGLAGTLCML